MPIPNNLLKALKFHFADAIVDIMIHQQEVTAEVEHSQLHTICLTLHNEPPFEFEMLTDICGVDYQEYGRSEWVTETATHTGFERGINSEHVEPATIWCKPRFAAVYHLLSLKHNQRLRLRTFVPTNTSDHAGPIQSVTDIWPSANWYEREAFDLYGIQFSDHPDLRRLLTDYEFEGHPFRKDFPLTGKAEVHYDAAESKVIYAPVTSVRPRTIIPKVIRSKVDRDNSQNDFDV